MTSSITQQPLSLVIVCCHAIFHGTDIFNEHHWALAPFQKGTETKPAEHITFLEHIRTGLRTLIDSQTGVSTLADNGTVLIFSGGPTKPSCPGLSEAQSYFRAAQSIIQNETEFSCLGELMDGKSNRILLEEYATDSFQNILFGILRYYEVFNKYPEKLIVVTHVFKEERFEVHRQAIKWNRQWTIKGVNPPFDDAEREMVIRLEGKNALDPFRKDLYGVRSPLKDKRITRGWHDETFDIVKKMQPPVVQRLVTWDGGANGHEVFTEKLEWES